MDDVWIIPALKKLAHPTDHETNTAERPDWVELIGSTVARIPGVLLRGRDCKTRIRP